MAFVILAVTAVLLVIVPAAVAFFLLVSSPDAFRQRATAPEDEETPTVLAVGRREVLRALEARDIEAARAAFLEMTGACGHCNKLFRRGARRRIKSGGASACAFACPEK